MIFNFRNFILNAAKLDAAPKEIYGIDTFLRDLEFHYFSKIALKNSESTDKSIRLVLEVFCNFNLLELLANFNTERWGQSINNQTPIQRALDQLNEINDTPIDIEELTLFLNDTTITIKRISEKSIALKFNDILQKIGFHYVFITKGLTKKPYEIFVPIYEDDNSNTTSQDENDILVNEYASNSYATYWGVYLDAEDEASIYNLQTNAYENGSLEYYLSETP